MREDGGDFRRSGAKSGKKWIWDWLSGDWEDGKRTDISAWHHFLTPPEENGSVWVPAR